MQLFQMLSNRNANGKVYDCDVARFIGYDIWNNLDYKKKQNLVNQFTQLLPTTNSCEA